MAEYGRYFLGSVIVSDRDGLKSIIDGQQRLTTLTLLLIYLHHQRTDAEAKGQLADLIFSPKFGKRSQSGAAFYPITDEVVSAARNRPTGGRDEPAKFEWPALLRKLDRVDPSYKCLRYPERCRGQLAPWRDRCPRSTMAPAPRHRRGPKPDPRGCRRTGRGGYKAKFLVSTREGRTERINAQRIKHDGRILGTEFLKGADEQSLGLRKGRAFVGDMQHGLALCRRHSRG